MTYSDVLRCPVCGSTLSVEENVCCCPLGHSFDRGRSGYVNLLLSSAKGRHGDDKAMVDARTVFLNKGYYAPLADLITSRVKSLNPELVVDSGCGEGYYSSRVSAASPSSLFIGLDISKAAINSASKHCSDGLFAVAGCNSMPLNDSCADVILNIFSPLFKEEYARVLKDNGQLLRVVPLEKHLHNLRAAIYDKPYDNDSPVEAIEGFSLLSRDELCYEITLPSQEDINALFMMTPYYYKTGRQDQEKLKQLTSITTQVQFCILTYKKK